MPTGESETGTVGADKRAEERLLLSRALSRAGYTDVLVLSRESGQKVLSQPRLEIIERLREGSVESVRGLADELGRDKAGVSRDLKILAERDVIEYEDHGRAKRPRLKHDTVVIEPVV